MALEEGAERAAGNLVGIIIAHGVIPSRSSCIPLIDGREQAVLQWSGEPGQPVPAK